MTKPTSIIRMIHPLIRSATATATTSTSAWRQSRAFSHQRYHNHQVPAPSTWSLYSKAAAAVTTASATAITVAHCEFQQQPSSSKKAPIIDLDEPKVSITEPISGITFPTTIITSTSPTPLNLIGVSCRLMRQLVQVYAVALYMEPTKTSLFKPFSKFTVQDMINTGDKIWDTITCPDKITKTFRIVVVRQVAGSHMGTGFQRALLPRAIEYSSKHGGHTPAQVKEYVKEFCKSFNKVGNMKVGSVADVVIDVDGTVKLVVDGRCVCVVKDFALAWALGDMYLGNDSVVPNFREKVANCLVDLF